MPLRQAPCCEILAGMVATFSSNDVSFLAGCSLRQLQWWDEQKVVIPARIGHAREYSQVSCIEACVVTALRRKGLSLQMIRTCLKAVRRELQREAESGKDSSEGLLIATDGRIVKVGSRRQVILFMTGLNRGAILVDLDQILGGIIEYIAKPPTWATRGAKFRDQQRTVPVQTSPAQGVGPATGRIFGSFESIVMASKA